MSPYITLVSYVNNKHNATIDCKIDFVKNVNEISYH